MNPNTQIASSDLKNFGLIMAGVIGVLFGLVFPTALDWNYLNVSWLFVSYFAVSALFIPTSLSIIYKIWSRIGGILNWVNSHIILGIIFIFMFIPIALFFKLIARDLLKKKFDASANSYRVIPPSNQPKFDLTKPY